MKLNKFPLIAPYVIYGRILENNELGYFAFKHDPILDRVEYSTYPSVINFKIGEISRNTDIMYFDSISHAQTFLNVVEPEEATICTVTLRAFGDDDNSFEVHINPV